MHWPLFINYEDINFHRWPNFKISAGTIFCWWTLFKIFKLKKEGIDLLNQKWCHDKINVIFVCIILLFYFSKDIYKFFFECQQHVTVHPCAQVRKLSYSHYDDDWEDICIKTAKYTYIKVKYKNIVATGLPSTSLQHLTFKNFNIWWTITCNIWKKSLTVCRHLKFCGWPALKNFTGINFCGWDILKNFADIYSFAEETKDCETVCL